MDPNAGKDVEKIKQEYEEKIKILEEELQKARTQLHVQGVQFEELKIKYDSCLEELSKENEKLKSELLTLQTAQSVNQAQNSSVDAKLAVDTFSSSKQESAAEEEASLPIGLKRGAEDSTEEPPRKIPAVPGGVAAELAMDVDEWGRTPLHRAAREGRVAEARALLRAGASTRSRDEEGNTPLHFALYYGQEAAAELLADADPGYDIHDKDRFTPLHLAALRGYTRVVRKLLRAGANTRSETENVLTPLHFALCFGGEPTAALIVDADAENDVPDKDGRTPLHEAAERGYIGVVRKLLLSGVRPHPMDNKGRSALELAEEEGHRDVVRSILSVCALQAVTIDWGEMEVGQDCVRMAAECEEEVHRMKETNVGGVSYHDVATRGVRFLAARLAHGGGQSELLRGGFEGRFPNCGWLIARRVEAARRRRDLLDRCLSLLSSQLPMLPLMTVEYVLSFLGEPDMQCLIDAFTGTS